MIAGVDEAGRGPLAGPVVAAAVVLNPGSSIDGLADSKKLSAARRDRLDQQIRAGCYWAIAMATVAEIDRLNIHKATLLAMRRAVLALPVNPDLALVDGKFVPDLNCRAQAEIGGDDRFAEISAASILAKQARDRLMIDLAHRYPDYRFDAHKGYPTRAHLAAIDEFGVLPIHRRSYAPIRARLEAGA